MSAARSKRRLACESTLRFTRRPEKRPESPGGGPKRRLTRGIPEYNCKRNDGYANVAETVLTFSRTAV